MTQLHAPLSIQKWQQIMQDAKVTNWEPIERNTAKKAKYRPYTCSTNHESVSAVNHDVSPHFYINQLKHISVIRNT